MDVIGCNRFSRSRGNGLLIIPTEAEVLLRKRCYSIPAGVAHSLESAATAATLAFAPYFLSLLPDCKNPIHPRTLDRNKSIPRTSSSLSSYTFVRHNKPPRIESSYPEKKFGDRKSLPSKDIRRVDHAAINLYIVYGKSWHNRRGNAFLWKKLKITG